jgi:hypothetical protein
MGRRELMEHRRGVGEYIAALRQEGGQLEVVVQPCGVVTERGRARLGLPLLSAVCLALP